MFYDYMLFEKYFNEILTLSPLPEYVLTDDLLLTVSNFGVKLKEEAALYLFAYLPIFMFMTNILMIIYDEIQLLCNIYCDTVFCAEPGFSFLIKTLGL